MPMRRKDYPPNWNEIARRIKELAGWKCEQCGVPDRVYILRSTVDKSRYVVMDVDGYYRASDDDTRIRVDELPMEFDESELSFVVLTTHHKGVPKPDGTPGDRRDKMDCRDENLAALCQRCHKLADADLHVLSSKATRIRKRKLRKREQGQQELWS